jgi:hypothetical protein
VGKGVGQDVHFEVCCTHISYSYFRFTRPVPSTRGPSGCDTTFGSIMSQCLRGIKKMLFQYQDRVPIMLLSCLPVHIIACLVRRSGQFIILCLRRSQMTINNKLLIYKQILRPVWQYGAQLWGCSKPSNINVIQRFQNKVGALLMLRGMYEILTHIEI